MNPKYKNGFDFVSANPPLHAGAKRLHLPPHSKEMLKAFANLTNEITDEFIRFLRSKFKDVKMIAEHLPKSMKLDPKMNLATLLSHCFPILYGLQFRSENTYQKMVNTYLKSRPSDAHKKDREKVSILISTFHQITESKQLLHIIARKTEMEAINYIDDQQLTTLVKEEIQSHCKELAIILDQCKRSITSSNKEENIFTGLISRAKGFSTFTEKKLIAFCDKDKIA